MITAISPSHHHVYAYLCRHTLWLQSIAEVLQVPPPLQLAIRRLNRRLPAERGLGILRPLPVESALDDTPIDSFLRLFSDEVTAIENNLLALMTPKTLNDEARTALRRVSGLWGRRIGQDILLSETMHKPPGENLEGLYELTQWFLGGTEWQGRRFLLRRQTPFEMSYELLHCPHRRHAGLKDDVKAVACALESEIFKGFFEALAPQATYRRASTADYCADFVLAPGRLSSQR